MPPRIALVSREYPPHFGGGIGTYARHIVPALAARGCTVHVITQSHNETHPSTERQGRITIHRVPMGVGLGPGCLSASIHAARVVADLARRMEIDIVEFAECEGAGAAFLMARESGMLGRLELPVVVHLHSPTELNLALNHEPTPEHPDPGVSPAIGAVVAAERWTIRTADAICAPSHIMASWAQQHFGLEHRPEIIPYAIGPVPEPTPAPTGEGRTLLYTGRLERRKGVDILCRAWALVSPDFPVWTLRMVGADTGTGPAGSSMRAYIESILGPQALRRTVFIGARPSWALPEEYRNAHACIIPSRWENFPNTSIEAMTHARPIIVSTRGGMFEMLADSEGGAAFRSEDAADCERAIRAVLALTDRERRAMGLRARARILQLCDENSVADARIDFYQRTIEAWNTHGWRTGRAERLGVWRDLTALLTSGALVDPLPTIETPANRHAGANA